MRVETWSEGISALAGRSTRKLVLSVCACAGKAMWAHSKKAAICKPEKELSPEPDHASTLILNFQPPRLWENKFLLGKPPGLWHFLTAAREEECNYFTLLHKLFQLWSVSWLLCVWFCFILFCFFFSPRELNFFLLEKGIRSQYLGIRCAHFYGGVIALAPFIGRAK